MSSPPPNDGIPLSSFLREARAISDTAARDLEGKTYREAYAAVLDGRIPAEKVGREWYIPRCALAAAVAALVGHKPRPVGRPRRSSSSNEAMIAA